MSYKKNKLRGHYSLFIQVLLNKYKLLMHEMHKVGLSISQVLQGKIH